MQKSWPVTGSSPKTAGSQSVNVISCGNLMIFVTFSFHMSRFFDPSEVFLRLLILVSVIYDRSCFVVVVIAVVTKEIA